MTMVSRKLKIEGMNCTACSMNIDFNLEDTEGVYSAKTSYQKQETEMEFDADKLSIQQIIEQIGKIGYKATVK